jgi:hypothetical protein
MTKSIAKKKKSTAKKAKPVVKPEVMKGPQVYVCTVDDWVRYRGKRYYKNDPVMVHPDKMTPEDLVRLHKHFDPKPTEIMTVTSEPVELLDEGDDHVSNSN